MKNPNASRTPERRRQIAALAGTARGRKLSKERKSEIAMMGYKAMLEARKARAAAAQASSPPSPPEAEGTTA